MSVYTIATPDKQEVRLRLVDEGVDLTRWISYSFSSNYLTPSDGFTFNIGDGNLNEATREELRIGARVKLFLDNFPVADGRIDKIEVSADRTSGTVYTIHGRDRLGPVVDSVADPRVSFKTGTTLAEFLKTLLAPYGWDTDEHFVMDASANKDAKTGGKRGLPTPKRKSKKGKLSKFQVYFLKPHNHEGLFRFISRTAERFGLFVKVSADGEKIIVSAPDYEQAPLYQLIRRPGETNILGGTVTFDGTDQPSVIVADGFSGGASPEFGRARLKAYCVNPYFGVDEQGFVVDEVSKVLTQYPEAEPVIFVAQPYKRRAMKIPPKPLFLHDEESKTQDQLNWFVKRTMSQLLKKSLVCHYEVEGHGQLVNGVFTPYDVDTVAEVFDEVAGVNERMYVLSRTFNKSRSGGTTTSLELVRLYSISADGDADEDHENDHTRHDNTGRTAHREVERQSTFAGELIQNPFRKHKK